MEENKQHSPVPEPIKENSPAKNPEPAMISFKEALDVILKGGKVYRYSWPNKETYCYMTDDLLKIHNADGKEHNWVLGKLDITSLDWAVL
jgi:hypothetical protein